MNPGESAAHAAKLRALLPIMDAHARGEEIQVRQLDDTWQTARDPHWSAKPDHYRIKPHPRTFYVLRYSDSSCMSFESESARDSYVKLHPTSMTCEAITMTEVL